MYWRDIGFLCSERTELDRFRKPTRYYNETQVFCNKKSVRQSEFYQAQAVGYRPEAVFELRDVDYNGESYFRHERTRYRVIRTYSRGGDTIELVCTSVISGLGEAAQGTEEAEKNARDNQRD